MMVRSTMQGRDSGAARASRAARTFAPMLAQRVTKLPRGSQWVYEFKWDGIRAIAHIDRGMLRLIGRNGSDFTERFPELHDLAHERSSMVLDGEIVIMYDGRVDFGRIQPRIHLNQRERIEQLARSSPATYMIFDVLECDGEDLMNEPLRVRRSRLEAMNLSGPHWAVPPIVRSHDDASGAEDDAADRALAVARQHDLEGVVAKRWESAYEPGARSDAWLKYKIVQAQEFVVGGWRPSQSGRSEVGALAVGYHLKEGDASLRFAGFVGSGFAESDHRQLLELLRSRQQEQSPFDDRLPKDDVIFVKPELVVHVRFAQWTAQGILRHPSYKGLRVDKPASQVVREL